MKRIQPTDIAEIEFEERDAQIFRIPDTKTKLDTLQKYFFPRLEFLLRHTLARVQEMYDVNPYERMTFVYTPRHRKDAKKNLDYGRVSVGLSGKRVLGKPLTVRHKDGTPYVYHPCRLEFVTYPDGKLRVELRFWSTGDARYASRIKDLVHRNLDALLPVLSRCHVSYTGTEKFLQLYEAFESESVYLYSPYYYFPIKAERGIVWLIGAFVALYPLLDSFISIGEGADPQLMAMLGKLKTWCLTRAQEVEANESVAEEGIAPDEDLPELLELDSYTFIRPGLWWQILARDNWTCCSCGRSSMKDGVVLHVDHIIPRSKGGTDDPSNLQTLCRKCNIGKSNKDDTDLRIVRP